MYRNDPAAVRRARLRRWQQQAQRLLAGLPIGISISVGLAVLVLFGAAFWVLFDPDADRVRIHFLNVGGDAILVRTPNRQHILIGAGTTPNGVVRALSTRLPVWVRKIDLLVLPDTSAPNLIAPLELAERYELGGVLDAGMNGTGPEVQSWRAVLNARKITGTPARAGQQIDLGGELVLGVLEAEAGRMVLRIGYRDGEGHSILLAGAANVQNEMRLLQNYPDSLRATLLHLPGHGSRTVHNPTFLRAVRPAMTIITPASTISGKPWAGPAPEVESDLERLQTKVYRVDEQGPLLVSFSVERELVLKRE